MPNKIYADTQNSVKKQMNDVWLSFSFEPHKELYNLSVLKVDTPGPTSVASGTNLKFTEIVGTKAWQKKKNVKQKQGHTGLDQTDGEAVIMVVKKPTGKNPVTIEVPYKLADGTSGTATIGVDSYAGKFQATQIADGPAETDNLPLENIIQIGDTSVAGGGLKVTGAAPGYGFKFVSMPKEWREQSFVRSIVPNTPKNYKEIDDHYDGTADTVQVTTITGLTISKVFEDMPGSFMMLTDRTVTVKGEMRENDSEVASEIHYFTGCRGTGKVTFNKDDASITELEASTSDWIHISGLA